LVLIGFFFFCPITAGVKSLVSMVSFSKAEIPENKETQTAYGGSSDEEALELTKMKKVPSSLIATQVVESSFSSKDEGDEKGNNSQQEEEEEKEQRYHSEREQLTLEIRAQEKAMESEQDGEHEESSSTSE
jgi:hypothetical protein